MTEDLHLLTSEEAAAFQQHRENWRRFPGVNTGPLGPRIDPADQAPDPPTPGDLTKRRFRVKQIFGNYLICRTWDGINEGNADVYVARPWGLQQAPFDGQTMTIGGLTITFAFDATDTTGQTRTATSGTTVETHKMSPPYWVNCEIRAEFHVEGIFFNPVGNNAVVWEDANDEGRQWCAV